MKKLLFALLTGVMILSLTACGGKGNANEQDKSGEVNPPHKHSDSMPEIKDTIESDIPEETDGIENNLDTSVSPSTNIRPEFKEAMDSYEEFFDEYVEFMKKYSESGYSISMISDYTQFMSQYTETMEAMGQLGEKEMSTEETAYYLEVTTRINQKLLNAIS